MAMLPEQYNIVFVNADSNKQEVFLGSKGRSLGRHMGMTDQGPGQEHASTALKSEQRDGGRVFVPAGFTCTSV